jgi:hypothetical protein
MPLSREAQFLRERAQRLRGIAEMHRSEVSEQLRMMAAELDQRASELEKSSPPDS